MIRTLMLFLVCSVSPVMAAPISHWGPSPLFTQGENDIKKWIGISLVIAAVAVGVFYGLVYAALRTLVA